MISFEFPPNSLVMGGAGTYAEFLADGLIRKGIDLHVITTGPRTRVLGMFTGYLFQTIRIGGVFCLFSLRRVC